MNLCVSDGANLFDDIDGVIHGLCKQNEQAVMQFWNGVIKVFRLAQEDCQNK